MLHRFSSAVYSARAENPQTPGWIFGEGEWFGVLCTEGNDDNGYQHFARQLRELRLMAHHRPLGIIGEVVMANRAQAPQVLGALLQSRK